jgi:hypothetical protein
MPAGHDWTTLRFAGAALAQGQNRLVLKAEACADCEIESLTFADQ